MMNKSAAINLSKPIGLTAEEVSAAHGFFAFWLNTVEHQQALGCAYRWAFIDNIMRTYGAIEGIVRVRRQHFELPVVEVEVGTWPRLVGIHFSGKLQRGPIEIQ
jgi:hypothetical protein